MRPSSVEIGERYTPVYQVGASPPHCRPSHPRDVTESRDLGALGCGSSLWRTGLCLKIAVNREKNWEKCGFARRKSAGPPRKPRFIWRLGWNSLNARTGNHFREQRLPSSESWTDLRKCRAQYVLFLPLWTAIRCTSLHRSASQNSVTLPPLVSCRIAAGYAINPAALAFTTAPDAAFATDTGARRNLPQIPGEAHASYECTVNGYMFGNTFDCKHHS